MRLYAYVISNFLNFIKFSSNFRQIFIKFHHFSSISSISSMKDMNEIGKQWDDTLIRLLISLSLN